MYGDGRPNPAPTGIRHYYKPETAALALPQHVRLHPPAEHTYLGRTEPP
jgi:hypothetical protein